MSIPPYSLMPPLIWWIALFCRKVAHGYCFKACADDEDDWVCRWGPDSCSDCDASDVCPFLKATCKKENYEGLDCASCTGCNGCDEQGQEWLTSANWYKLPPSKVNIDRHGWFFNRQPMDPIVGDTTLIAGVLYSFAKQTLKLSVLFPPLYPMENREAFLLVESQSEDYAQSTKCNIMEDIWHCLFRVEDLPMTGDFTYEVIYFPDKNNKSLWYTYEGEVPMPSPYPRVAAMSCFGTDDTKDKYALVEAVHAESPDLVVLQGDLVYGKYNIFYGILETIYTIRDLTRNQPTIVQLDDHDYSQGNIWGAGYGCRHNSGCGFVLPTCHVNLIQDLSLSHNPDFPGGNRVLENGMDVHYTNYEYGDKFDFAILEARKFKNKLSTEEGGGSLLGAEQESWLEEWCRQEDGKTKVVLTQTPFATLATHWIYQKKGILKEDRGPDANGFPPAGRTRAMEILQGCSQLILSGDQHLSIAVYYDDFGIGECASPAAINDIFWRINKNDVGKTHTDVWGNTYTLKNIWQVDDDTIENFHPAATRNTDEFVKANRTDGFMTVKLGKKSARCRAHSYRTGIEEKWTTKFKLDS